VGVLLSLLMRSVTFQGIEQEKHMSSKTVFLTPLMSHTATFTPPMAYTATFRVEATGHGIVYCGHDQRTAWAMFRHYVDRRGSSWTIMFIQFEGEEEWGILDEVRRNYYPWDC
jgi:hypothetical protein